MTELTPEQIADDPFCICCCRPLSQHNSKRQCPETSYFIANEKRPEPNGEVVAYTSQYALDHISPFRPAECWPSNHNGNDVPLYTHPDPSRAIIEGLVEALGFYADESRYFGPNQLLKGPDKWSTDTHVYRKDVTRDNGDIARAALASARAYMGGK